MPQTVPTKPFDWTYTTLYPGHSTASSSSTIEWKPAERNNALHTIPLAELTRHDPILFYAEIPLYEDELHDNGASHLLVRIVSLVCPPLSRIRSHNSRVARDANMHIHPATVHAEGR